MIGHTIRANLLCFRNGQRGRADFAFTAISATRYSATKVAPGHDSVSSACVGILIRSRERSAMDTNLSFGKPAWGMQMSTGLCRGIRKFTQEHREISGGVSVTIMIGR